MTASQIIDAIVARVGKEFVRKYGETFILDTLNRIYQQYNDEYELIEKQTTFSFSTFDTDGLIYKTLPNDWIRPYKIDPFRNYRQPHVFDNSIDYNTFTIHQGKIFFSGVSSQSSFTVDYYATGITLQVQQSGGQTVEDAVKSPEWDSWLHPALIYLTALELMAEYPLRKQDIYQAEQYKRRLATMKLNRQQAAPNIVGPLPRLRPYLPEDDPYLVDD